jgi:hypothetical protein
LHLAIIAPVRSGIALKSEPGDGSLRVCLTVSGCPQDS